jgi:TrmH family RNA methyltransferase
LANLPRELTLRPQAAFDLKVSMASNLISQVRNLQQRKGRKRTGLTIAEGVRLVEEALDADVPIRGAVVAKSLGASERGAILLGNLAARAIPLTEVDDRSLAGLAETEAPQGVIAVIEQRLCELSRIEVGSRVPVLVLDGVQDPGNVGALIRTAYGLGAAGAVLLPETGDIGNPKAIRAAMGASFRLPVAHATVAELASWAAAQSAALWVADAEGAPIGRVGRQERVALVVGNEGAGIRPAVLEIAHRRVAIPLARGAESLNVAVAAGIILYEVQRVG